MQSPAQGHAGGHAPTNFPHSADGGTTGYKNSTRPGYEADDVIATAVQQVRTTTGGNAVRMYICSRDKDLDQLIDDSTFLFDIQTGETVDAGTLLRQKGYTPAQAADILALTGDTADNISGVPGVGPKTAAKWIAQYGSLDNLLARSSEIPGKAGESLRASLDILGKSRQLVRLQRDVKFDFHWPLAPFDPARLERLVPVFEELNFRRLLPTLRLVCEKLCGRVPQGLTLTAPSNAATTESTVKPRSKPRHDTPAQGMLFGLPNAPTAPDRPVAPATVASLQPPDLSSSLPSTTLGPVVGSYQLVNTPETLADMLRELQTQLEKSVNRWLAIDTETDALGALQSNICGISLCASPGRAFYIAIRGGGACLPVELLRTELAALFTDTSIKKIGQNIKYDLNVLRVAGLPLEGIFFDTMLASYVLDPSRASHSMDALANDLLGLKPIAISELIGRGASQISFADVPLDRACAYAAEDADVTYRLAAKLHPTLEQASVAKLYHDLEMPLLEVLADMEFTGIKVDAQPLRDMSRSIDEKLLNLEQQIYAQAGGTFNIDSPKQLAAVLFGKLGLPISRKNKTGPSTDIGVLESLADRHPVPAMIVEYRQLAKLKNTYLDTLANQASPRTGRVHASFNQTVAETGRLSSSDPNLQNIPIRTELGREIRRAFVAGDSASVLVSADYSQIELRVLAHFCKEPELIKAFAEDQDVHRFVATQIFNVTADAVTADMRRIAKTVNFGIIYGQTAFGLAKQLKISQREAEDFIRGYKARFPGIEQFSNECIQQASATGFVSTILGRTRKISEIHSSNQSIRNFGQRAAVNTVIQGSAADLIKLSMVNLHRKLAPHRPQINLLLQIHDELVFEAKRDSLNIFLEIIRCEMENAMKLLVPLKVDIGWGDNWLEAKA
ncbi:MAG: DNA polymerase I [Phycisphaerales bacterium]|nr:DNA polymerase I [Phycisphaerales bacterium]